MTRWKYRSGGLPTELCTITGIGRGLCSIDVLEKARGAISTPYWFGDRIGHADIAVACVLRFTGEAHPARCEALPVFAEIVHPLIPPSGD